MKGDKKYLIVLLVVLGFYIFYELQKPKELDWTPTYHFKDKIPFGTYVTHDLMKDMFEGREANHSFSTIYFNETNDVERTNQLMIGNQILLSELDFDALLNFVDEGYTVMMAGNRLSGRLMDSLDFSMGINEAFATANIEEIQDGLIGELNTKVHFNIEGRQSETFTFPFAASISYFDEYNKDNWEVLAANEDDGPVVLRLKDREGQLILSSLPMAFTNYFVLDEKTSGFAETMLSFFPKDEALTHNEFYHIGRVEPTSKVRFFLRHEPLKWALFLLIVVVLIFMLFESKRRQRVIPVVKPLQNTTLEFVNVLGRLYYRQSDHAKLASKRIAYWKEFVRSHYNLSTEKLDQHFIDELVRKSGRKETSVKNLVSVAQQLEEGREMSSGELLLLEKQLNEFYDIK